MDYRLIVGLETHVELSTEKKMFCGCSADYFQKTPNSHTCPVCLGLPGALPVPNFDAIRWTMMIGLALNCKINLESFFERKNYFYPDLPKGYQISQYLKPFCYEGYLTLDSGKKIRITRVHLEEDTGKLLHGAQLHDKDGSYLDFNRSGVPLVEIVTEADITSPEEASEYLKKLQLIIKYVGASDADMEKGSMRCEPNISITKETTGFPPYKVEVKNINSFRFVRKAIEYEITRQKGLLEAGAIPAQETRRYVESSEKTESMRSKEEAHDYRYFPEPDIPPFHFDETFLDEIKKELNEKELPHERMTLLTNTHKLRPVDAVMMVENKEFGDLFLSTLNKDIDAPKMATFMVNKKNSLSSMTKEGIVKMFLDSNKKEDIDQTELENIVSDVISKNTQAVADYKNGKQASLQFLLGMTMRAIGKKVDAKLVIEEIKKKIA